MEPTDKIGRRDDYQNPKPKTQKLTLDFFRLLESSSEANRSLDLNHAATMLQVPKRRIDGITNVLEEVGLLTTTKSSNLVQWTGRKCSAAIRAEYQDVKEELGSIQTEEHKLNIWISRLRRLQQAPDPQRFLTTSDVSNILNDPEEDSDQSLTEQPPSRLAIHAPAASLIQVASPCEPLPPTHNLMIGSNISAPLVPGKYRLHVSATGNELQYKKKRRRSSDDDPIQVYMLPQTGGGPPKPIMEDCMVRLLALSGSHSPLDNPSTSSWTSDCAVLELDERASSFF